MNDLSSDLKINHSLSITKQSIDEKFNKSTVSFAKELLREALKKFVIPQLDNDLFPSFKKVKIKGSTSFVLPKNMSPLYPEKGVGNEAKAKIQFEYDLKSNRIEEVTLSSLKTNDYQSAYDTMDMIGENDLIIRDLGYISIELLELIQGKGAYFVNRVKPQTAIYGKKNGKYQPISFKNILKQLRSQTKPFIVKQLYVGWRRYLPCRVIFSLVPDEKVKERRKRHERKSKKRKAKSMHEKTIEYLDLNIFITNTSEEQIPSFQLFDIYKLRWQIELIFKSWKSICNINKYRKARPERIETCIYIQLLWVITNWHIIQVFTNNFLIQKRRSLSIFKAYKAILIANSNIRRVYRNRNKMIRFIKKLGDIFEERCLIETRKGRVSSEHILLSII